MYKFFNILFRISLIFLIFLIWFRYFINNFTYAILYTVLATVVVEVSLHFILKNRKEKEYMKTKEETQVNKIAISFSLNPEQTLNFFYNLAKVKYNATKRKSYITVEHSEMAKKQENENRKEELNLRTILFPAFSMSALVPQDIVNILNKLKKVSYNKLVVCGNVISKEAYVFANQITAVEIILLDKKDTYLKLMKPNNFYPEELTELRTSTKMKIKEIVAYSLNKKRSKGYFFASIILLISSFIFRINIYYIIMSSLLLILSLISFVLPKYNIVKTEEIL